VVDKKNVTIIEKDKVPGVKLVGEYTFLRDMGKGLKDEQAIQIKVKEAPEAKKIQNRWRAYFKGKAHTRKETQPDGSLLIYLWKES